MSETNTGTPSQNMTSGEIPSRTSRRELLKIGGAKTAELVAKTAALEAIGTSAFTATALGIKYKAGDVISKGIKNIPDAIPNPFGDEKKADEPSIRLFENNDTEELKRKLKITITDFIRPQPLGDDMEFMKSDQLLPIFHPGIKDHEEMILKMAKKYGHNPNIIAFIASIQSGGNAASPGGLFGITRETFDEKRTEDTTDDDMYNPEINADCAMKALSDCIKNTENRLDVKYIMEAGEPYHPEFYAQAIHELIYEAEQTNLPFDEQSEMSQNNLLTIRSFFNTWNMAFNLRKGNREEGIERMDDHEIRANLKSTEVDARMFAIANNRGNIQLDDLVKFFSNDDIPNPEEFKLLADYEGISFSKVKELRSLVFSYESFKEGKKRLSYPLNPWLRRHHATTSASDITDFGPNAQVNSWSD